MSYAPLGMNIVIVGAGETGRHIATLLSADQHNVVLIDTDAKRLEEVSWQMDVATKEGSGTDWQLLDHLLELSPDLFIAVTSEDQTNFVACSLAKQLGYPRTIARVRDNRYLNRTRLDFARIFNIDYFIGPELLVAHEIYKYIVSPGSLRVESFAHGAVQLRTLKIPTNWRKADQTLMELKLPSGIMIALIYREGEVIFPHGNDRIFPGDEVTLIGETQTLSSVHQFFGLEYKDVSSVMIIGGSRSAINLSKILGGRNIDVRLIEKDYQKCCSLSEALPNATVINHDGTDLEFLQSEKVERTGAFVVSTHSDELNVMTGLLGKEGGAENVVIQLSNPGYLPIAQRVGIAHTPSPRTIAANRVLALALSQTLTSIVSLYQRQAEIMEIQVSMTSPIAGIPISELGPLLPKDFLIAVIQNRGRVIIADGSRIISPGDTVIVVSDPKHLHELENIF